VDENVKGLNNRVNVGTSKCAGLGPPAHDLDPAPGLSAAALKTRIKIRIMIMSRSKRGRSALLPIEQLP
jgi:hypothetical protein